jgi:hypothetical protein
LSKDNESKDDDLSTTEIDLSTTEIASARTRTSTAKKNKKKKNKQFSFYALLPPAKKTLKRNSLYCLIY